ncbi:hypothetical protein E8A66_12535 [Vibrio cholerae]|nr:conserved hypothetical protein [Vibrio cholerae O395]EGQ8120734.1 hypothetical protein [Vibrio cholerae]MEB3776655.1 hypothetical protein [Vibrio sp. R-1]OFJ23377.1 hypothetical protein BFX31_02600 [Vibrio paracholerae]OFJ39548.1 hypothetical protein BFX33_02455 [Vibrio cholerae V52]QHQ91565.1 hypothetical protein FKV26_00150 [Vibrio cholerae O1]RBM27963.1 hypothetical protein DLR59_08010 [Vibrio tarriae]
MRYFAKILTFGGLFEWDVYHFSLFPLIF